jgi:hypothetical protein
MTHSKPVIVDWKKKFFEVKIIGPEPAMTQPPWKKVEQQELTTNEPEQKTE